MTCAYGGMGLEKKATVLLWLQIDLRLVLVTNSDFRIMLPESESVKKITPNSDKNTNMNSQTYNTELAYILRTFISETGLIQSTASGEYARHDDEAGDQYPSASGDDVKLLPGAKGEDFLDVPVDHCRVVRHGVEIKSIDSSGK